MRYLRGEKRKQRMRQRMRIDPRPLALTRSSITSAMTALAPPTLRLGTTTATSMGKRAATTTKNTANKKTVMSPPSKPTVTKNSRMD